MQPKLLYSIMCDAAAPGPEGKMTLYGIFDRINVTTIPAIHRSFAIVTAWQSGDRQYKMQLRILGPDQKQVFESPEMAFELRGKFAKSQLVLEFDNMMFRKLGTYLVQVLLHGEVKMEYPFFVAQTRPPQKLRRERGKR